MTGLIRYLVGSVRMRCDGGRLEELLQAMMQAQIPYDSLMRDGEGNGRFRVFRGDAGRVLQLDKGAVREGEEGLPALLWRYRYRWGLMVGGVLFALIVTLSTQVIWSMEVVGNESVSDLTILSVLKEQGCEVGSYIPRLDLWQIGNRSLERLEGLSFLSVNLEGTHAQVVVKEQAEKDMAPSEEGAPSHLIAARDGQILRYEVRSGQAVVKVLDVVRKGDLLVSGVVNTKVRPDTTFRLERSVGQVFAQTVRPITVSVPLRERQTVHSAPILLEKRLIFFSFAQKVFEKGGKIPLGYDIIQERTQWTLPRFLPFVAPVPLPIWTESTYGAAVEEQWAVRSEEEARERCYLLFWRMLAEELEDKELVDYEISEQYDPDAEQFTLTARVTCIEDIAIEVPILLSELTEEGTEKQT